jgi:hypothetical protein
MKAEKSRQYDAKKAAKAVPNKKQKCRGYVGAGPLLMSVSFKLS